MLFKKTNDFDMKRFPLFVLFVFATISAFAQKISVESFKPLPMDMTASSLEGKRIDQNGEKAALIKVVTSQTGFTFEGGTLGIVDTKQENGEIWVWVPRSARKITIKHQKLGVLREYMYPVEIEAERTYEMVLTTDEIETVVKTKVRQQYLSFQITPPNGTLEVNDKIWEVDADGIAQEYVEFGTYTWRVQALNYHTEAGMVTVDDPDNTKFVTVTLNPNYGWIEVDGKGDLRDASVYVDNILIGKAPCKSDALKSGQHSVRIAKKMFDSYSETVTVRDNETTKLAPALKADYAEVTLKVDADAEIWVNDELKGVGSWKGQLGRGVYKMECKKDNHETSLTSQEITPAMHGQTINLPVPKPIYGSLMVESIPRICQIYIDGKDMGTTPKSINEILIGQHELKLTKEGYADYVETVTIAKDEQKQVKAELSKKPEAVSNQPVATPSDAKEGALSGVFSVGAGKKVCFSQGNLQYQASTNTWRFAEHQYDVIGESNSNISSSYSGWIDLFGWGASGYNGKNPYMTSTTSTDYGNGSTDIAGTNYDWGVYAKITNGGNQTGLWRTLTKDEWVYVFNTRSTTSGIRYARACVNGMKGVILLPDDWNSSYYSLRRTNSLGASFGSNTISASQWSTLEQHGAVFLPAAGRRDGTSVGSVGSYGLYWSASYNYNDSAYRVWFYDSGLYPVEWGRRDGGLCVRLVRSTQ